MKNLLSLIFAGIIGGLISFTLIKNQTSQENPSNTTNNPQAVLTNFHNKAPSNLPMDFVDASAIATPAVVHIKASQSRALAQQKREERKKNGRGFGFDEFFGGQDFFWGNQRPKGGSGSGVIISEDGYIVTNNHVAGFADQIIVTLDDGREYQATKIGTDASSDLAVLKIEGFGFPHARYADSDEVQVGEWVLAVGNPFDYLTSTVTAGIVSAKGRDINIIRDDKPIEEFIQTDAAINPGNSGGALVNTDGELIGINTAIATPTGVFAGYSFAIPSNLVERIVEEIKENGGDIERAYLGVNVAELAEVKEKGIKLFADNGVYVDKVIQGSSAQFSGILPGDVIQKVNNEKVENFEDLKARLKFMKVGDSIELKINRKGKQKTLNVNIR